ncbi:MULTISPECIES: hypothetical protein [unclassified Bradyrhizobium]|uniref:hypothetical protein n=1 Tax=Bradyrhizobium sp. USDA 4541 TaxID=2817704 RepID=UPI0020A34409|nr:hypothetical protein [Bradyrhizobium sp. USDA 4541]MCP1851233.1 hypothetical protein [Bradyrhizobium sp. USDA 4541]
MALFKSSIATLETQAQNAQEELAAAEAAFSSAMQAMEQPPIELSDDQVGDLVSVKNLAEVRLVKARASVRRTEVALSEARAAAAEKERRESLARVNAMGANAQKLLEAFLASTNKEAQKVLRTMAQAELAREELNKKLPEDQRIEPFELAVLMSPTIPRQDISRTRELHWLNPHGGRPYGPEFARKIKDNGNGTAYLSSPGTDYSAGHTTNITKRQYFDRVRFSDWVRGTGASSLAEVLALPGLRGGVPGWRPMDRASPESILQELDRIESAEAPAERAPEVKELLEPVSPVFSTVEELKAWEAEQAAQAKADKAA